MLSGSCTLAWASSSEVMDATLGGTSTPAKEGEGPGWAALWLTDSAENECLFLAFFFPSPLRWPFPFPLDGEALGEGPGEQGPNGAGSELGPGPGEEEEKQVVDRSERRGEGEDKREERESSGVTFQSLGSHPEQVFVAFPRSFLLAAFQKTSSITIITYNSWPSETPFVGISISSKSFISSLLIQNTSSWKLRQEDVLHIQRDTHTTQISSSPAGPPSLSSHC
ncbi:hypothetical protein F7725_001837, partial [Dissostichus mawsoni]